jgi:hypothetical protein
MERSTFSNRVRAALFKGSHAATDRRLNAILDGWEKRTANGDQRRLP